MPTRSRSFFVRSAGMRLGLLVGRVAWARARGVGAGAWRGRGHGRGWNGRWWGTF
jgi:hypothetical protein